MNMQEIARFILYLQHKGWTDTEINRFMLYLESGDEKYKDEPDTKKTDGKQK